MRNESNQLQQEIDKFAIEYPAILNKISDYFSKRGVSTRQIIEAKAIDDLIDQVDDKNVDAFMIQLAGLLRYYINN